MGDDRGTYQIKWFDNKTLTKNTMPRAMVNGVLSSLETLTAN